MDDIRKLSVSGIVYKDNQVLLVRKCYGAAKGLLIIPGGYLQQGEMLETALEREIQEETGITVKSLSLAAVRFTVENWWVIFIAKYISGNPQADGKENSDAAFFDCQDAVSRSDISSTTLELLLKCNKPYNLENYGFFPVGVQKGDYTLYL